MQVLTRESFVCKFLHMDTTEKQRIGQRIVAARSRKGMSQLKLAEALAERAGDVITAESVRRSLVNNENGIYAPRLRTLQSIAEITEQPLDFFLGSPEVATATATFPDAA